MRRSTLLRWWMAAAVVPGLALAQPATSRPPPPSNLNCPVRAPGTKVTALNVKDGVALDFNASSPEQVDLLRQRVQHMARQYNQRGANGMMMRFPNATGTGGSGAQGTGTGMMGPGAGKMGQGGGMMGQGCAMMGPGGMHHGRGMGGAGMEGMGAGMMLLPASTASVENLQDGARLVLRPANPSQLVLLRTRAAAMAAHLAGGRCPIMSAPNGSAVQAPATGGSR